MNEINPTPRSPEHVLIDRLVDGELGFDDRRALLERLDRAPDGWRRCALAYIEAQVWRASLAAAGKPASFDPDFDVLPPAKILRRRRLRPAVRLAACLLLGFGLGLVGRGLVDREPRPVEAPLAGVPVAGVLLTDPGSEGPLEIVAGAAPLSPLIAPTAPLTVGYIQFEDETRESQVDPAPGVPVLDGPGLDESWLRSQPSFLPEDVRVAWERRGYRVDRQRRLISVQVDDAGAYLSIPVDEVKLHFVGGPL